DDLAISDLILGATSQGESWVSPQGNTVPLGPLGAYDRRQPVDVFWQVQSRIARDVTLTVALFRLGRQESERPVLEVSTKGTVEAGLSEWQRNLGVEHLEAGSYRMEVIVADAAGEVSVSRSATLHLW